MRALTGIPSTVTSSKFRLVGKVSRGFGGRVIDAASPPGAALPSFPERSGHTGSATGSGGAAANGTGGGALTASDCCGVVGRRRLGKASEDGEKSEEGLLPGCYRQEIGVGEA